MKSFLIKTQKTKEIRIPVHSLPSKIGLAVLPLLSTIICKTFSSRGQELESNYL